MKPLLTLLLLLSCSGEEFQSNDKGNDTAPLSGESGETSTSGSGGLSPSEGGSASGVGVGGLGMGGKVSEELGGSSPQAGSSGASTMAGRPTMGEGGAAGQQSVGGLNLSRCLAQHQTLACASVCDSQPTCQGILDCFVSHNSDLTTDCPGFNDTGYSLALQAERNCCND